MTLAEKIAEKKRLAALAEGQATAPEEKAVAVEEAKQEKQEKVPAMRPDETVAPPETVVTGTEIATQQQTEDKAAGMLAPNVAVAAANAIDKIAAASVPLVDANGKPLSGFALVKARKEMAAKLLALQKETPDVQIQDSTSPASVGSTTVVDGSNKIEKKEEKKETAEEAVGQDPIIAEIHDAAEEDADHEAKYESATPEARQAYSDVKIRLDALVSVSGEDLRNEMSLLKKALMQNPNAVELMLPSDIGQMVIALRKMTGVELAAIKAGKSTGTKAKKEAPLTADQLQSAWEEL